MTVSSDNEEAAFIALRMASLAATPGFCGGAEARRRLAEFYRRAGTLGRVHRVVRDKGQPVAQVMFFRDPDAWFGGPVVLGFVDRVGAADLRLLLEVIDAHRVGWGEEALLEVAALDGVTVAALVERGFGIDSVIQVGCPRRAARALAASVASARPQRAPAIEVAPMSLEHVEAVTALHAAVFSAEPEWCWFGAYPRHLERMADALRSDLAGQFVVRQGGQIVGHLGAEVAESPYWGRVGGLELVLAPALRGQGYARELYRVALASLVERGARVMKGGTAQPGVMALGRTMGRPWHAFNLRAAAPFPVAHFMRFAPAAVRAALG